MSEDSQQQLHCPRCGYTTAYRSNLKKHLARKTLCQPLLADLDRAAMATLHPELFDKRQLTDEDKTHVCQTCQSRFTTPQALSRHKHHYCQGAAKTEESLISKLLEVNQELLRKIDGAATSHTTNQTNCNNNIQVNVVYNAFGKESEDHLSHPFLNRCVMRTDKGLLDLLQKLHFDPNVPANATVRIPNRKTPTLCQVRNESGEWMYARRDKVVSEMLDKGTDILNQHFDENQEEIRTSTSETMWNYIENWVEQMKGGDRSKNEDLLLDVYILLLNNSTATQGVSST